MTAMNLNLKAVKEARKHRALAGKNPLGRGKFCAVFDGTRKNTVLKMTVDETSYYMLNDGVFAVEHRMFPRVVDNYGEIGAIKRHGREFPIYLFEVERLHKLENDSDARRLARKISQRSASVSADSKRIGNELTFDVIKKLTVDASLPRRVRNAFADLENFYGNFFEGAIDLHMGNFMQRKNGELVINDPLANMRIMSALA